MITKPRACCCEVSGPRVERQSQCECLLAGSALGSLQCLGDHRRCSFLSSQCFHGPHMNRCPGTACRDFLSHQTTPDVKEWPLCSCKFPQRKAQRHCCFQPVDNKFGLNGGTGDKAAAIVVRNRPAATSAKPSANFTISLLCFFAPWQEL